MKILDEIFLDPPLPPSDVTDDQQQHEEIFDFRTLPPNEQELIHKIQRNESQLVPFGVYMEVRNIDGLQDNDIVRILIFSEVYTHIKAKLRAIVSKNVASWWKYET